MKPAGPIPPYFSADDRGQLLIGGRSCDELVAEAGRTPLFVYDNNIVGAQIARFKGAMPDGISLFYSVSANPYQPLLEFLGRYVDGFRIVSVGELKLLEQAKLAGLPINFAGPAKLDSELDEAVRTGATISIESEGDARRAIAAAERARITPRICVRVTPPFTIEAGRIAAGQAPSPFGVDAERVPGLVCALLEAGADWRGLHMFSGVQCLDAETLSEVYRLSLECSGEIAGTIGRPIPEINLGSGFDVPCAAGDEPLDVDAVARNLNRTLCETSPLLATTRFTIELGRWLVGECGVYLTRIIDRSESGGRIFLATDGGGHHFMRATGMLGERGTVSFPIGIANRFNAPVDEEVSVTGCLCTPFDVLGDEIGLPHADVGDLVAVFCAGAYGLTASPQAWESRPPARELLV